MEENELESYKKAGEIAKKVRDFARDYVREGMKLIDLANAIDDKIAELGAEPAFPVNLSIDEIAAHFTPDSNSEEIAEGILKIDLGVHVEGFIADTAVSVDLTEDKEFEEMINLNGEILERAVDSVSAESCVGDVGDVAQEVLEKWNEEKDSKFSIIKSLSGHSLAQDQIHSGLTISNYRNGNRTPLKGMAFAIEPFVTTGVGDVYEGAAGGILVVQRNMPVRDKDSRELLKFIREKYKTRPFCLRWLEKENFGRLKFVISSLVRQGILYEYPMLVEKSKAPVSQMEHTIVISEEGEIMVTTR